MSPSLYQYIVDGYQKALEYDRVSNNLRMLLGSDAQRLAAEMARTTYLDQLQAIDAVKDCWAYDGRDLEKSRETIVRAVLQLEALRKQVPEPVGDRCVQTLLDEPFVWPEPGEPSTLREDLEAAIEAVSDAPYQPVTRYRHPADVPSAPATGPSRYFGRRR